MRWRLVIAYVLLMSYGLSFVYGSSPPIGNEPRWLYGPFFHDPTFDNKNHHFGGTLPQDEEYPSGKWYTAYTMSWDPRNYADISNGRLYLKAIEDSTGTGYVPWSAAIAMQGRLPSHKLQAGKFKGSNSTESDAVDTYYLIFPYNETTPELWLYVKVKVIDRASLHYENPTSWANIGLDFLFQYEFYDEFSGTLNLSDYDNPDYFYKWRAIQFDLFLSRVYWTFGSGPFHYPIGSESSNWGTSYDNDIHVQRVEGVIDKIGIWYSFKINISYAIERAKVLAQNEMYKYQFGNRYLTALILRQVQVFVESSGAMIEGVWDYAFFSTDQYAMQTIDLNSYDFADLSSPAPTFWYIDDEFWGVSYGDNGPTILLPPWSWHKVWVYEPIWQRKDDTWIKWTFRMWYNDQVSPFFSSDNPLKMQTGEYDGYMNATFVAQEKISPYEGAEGGGGGTFGIFFVYSPPVPAEYGQIKHLNQSGWIDQITFVRIRQTLGNRHGDLVVSVFLKYGKTVVLKLLNIERVEIDLGKIMEAHGYNQNFWSHQVDDFTMEIEVENVTYADIVLRNVPPILQLEKNGIAMPRGSFWNYTNGHLHFRLYSGDPEIYVDFETAFSLTYNVLIQSSVALIAMLTIAWLYRRLRNL